MMLHTFFLHFCAIYCVLMYVCVYILVREGLPSPAQSTPCVCNPCQLSPQSNLSTTISWDVTRTCVCVRVCMCPGRWGWCQTESINCSPSVCAAQCVCVHVCEPLIPCIPAPSLFLWICIHIWCLYMYMRIFSFSFIYFFKKTFFFFFYGAHCWIFSGWWHGENTPHFLLFLFLNSCSIPAPDFPFLHAWKPSYLPTSSLTPSTPPSEHLPLLPYSPAPRKRSLSWGRELRQDPLFTLGWRVARTDGTKRTGKTRIYASVFSARAGMRGNRTNLKIIRSLMSVVLMVLLGNSCMWSDACGCNWCVLEFCDFPKYMYIFCYLYAYVCFYFNCHRQLQLIYVMWF